MNQRGRKPAAALSIVTQMPGRLLEPPVGLPAEQAEVWRKVVATKPVDWFDAGSIPILTAYCRATVEADRIGLLISAMSTEWLSTDEGLCRYKELRKMQAAVSTELTGLATKLRLTQQSRYRADAADVASRKAGASRPWVIEQKETQIG